MAGWQAFAGPLSYNEEITLAVCGDFLSWQTLQWEANESMLTEDKIRQAAGKGSYPKGCDYFARGRVKRVYRRGNGFFEAEVRGSQLYYVEMKIDENGDVSNMLCDCPAFGNYDGACKHLVAVLKKIQQDWRTYFSPTHAIGADLITTAGISSTPSAVSPPGPAEATRRLLSFFRAAPRAISRSGELQTVRLVPTYYFVPHHYNPWGGESWLEFSIGVERLYVVKSIPEFLQARSNNTELVFGKQFAMRASNSEFDEKSKATRRVTQGVQLRQEIETAALIQKASVYATGLKTDLAGADQWSDDGSDPVEAAQAAKAEVRKACGQEPNILVVGASVYARLLIHPALKAYLSGSERKILTDEVLRNLFGVEEIIVGKAVSAVSKDAPVGDVWGKFASLLVRPSIVSTGNDEGIQSFGYTFRRRGQPVVDTYPDAGGKLEYCRYTDIRKPAVVGGACGYLFNKAIA